MTPPAMRREVANKALTLSPHFILPRFFFKILACFPRYSRRPPLVDPGPRLEALWSAPSLLIGHPGEGDPSEKITFLGGLGQFEPLS